MKGDLASRAALREAALAVVAHLHGLRVNRLQLEPPASGHELLDALRYGLDYDRIDLEQQFVAALKRAEVALAGDVALEHYLGLGPGQGDGEAEKIATAIVERLSGSPRQQRALRAFLRARLL
ncbi:MAG TPA: hypothetical protein VIW02_02345, partial [Gammaproteobacteria bacterium]